MKYRVVCRKTKKKLKMSVEDEAYETAKNLYGIDPIQECIWASRQEITKDCCGDINCPNIKVIKVKE